MILYQFTISPFCEKVRWALDYKALPYQVRNLIPGPHLLQVRRLAPSSSVPVLQDQEIVIQGSSEILDYLERCYPERRLNPVDETLQAQVIEWESWLEKSIAVELRRFFYAYMLDNRALTTRQLLQGAPWYGTWLYALIYPKLKIMMQQNMNITPSTAERAYTRLQTGFARINERLQTAPFLLGEQFSRVDLTAASFLASLCRPPEHSYRFAAFTDLPEPLRDLQQEVREMPLFDWTLQIYRHHRCPVE